MARSRAATGSALGGAAGDGRQLVRREHRAGVGRLRGDRSSGTPGAAASTIAGTSFSPSVENTATQRGGRPRAPAARPRAAHPRRVVGAVPDLERRSRPRTSIRPGTRTRRIGAGSTGRAAAPARPRPVRHRPVLILVACRRPRPPDSTRLRHERLPPRLADDNVAAGGDDRELLGRDRLAGVAEQLGVLERDVRQHLHARARRARSWRPAGRPGPPRRPPTRRRPRRRRQRRQRVSASNCVTRVAGRLAHAQHRRPRTRRRRSRARRSGSARVNDGDVRREVRPGAHALGLAAAPRRRASVEPLPFVPTTWIASNSRSGLPSRPSRSCIRSSPNRMPNSCERVDVALGRRQRESAQPRLELRRPRPRSGASLARSSSTFCGGALAVKPLVREHRAGAVELGADAGDSCSRRARTTAGSSAFASTTTEVTGRPPRRSPAAPAPARARRPAKPLGTRPAHVRRRAGRPSPPRSPPATSRLGARVAVLGDRRRDTAAASAARARRAGATRPPRSRTGRSGGSGARIRSSTHSRFADAGGRRVLARKARLDRLDVPVAEVVPDERVERLDRGREVVVARSAAARPSLARGQPRARSSGRRARRRAGAGASRRRRPG